MREKYERTLPANSSLHSGHIFWHEESQQYHARDDDYVEEAEGMNWALATFTKCQKEIQGLRMLLWFVKDHFDMNDLDKAMPRVYEKLKDATTNIIKSNHNTSCTYQFELAFHNLQDTPELRKMYWSALGQLHFDSNDQVITPELEECPCCKGNQDA
ncbi:hypothetical protein [Acinetobacter baumannii]|uniref:hypothetical protein n=1 Tax=Acinetobacter baumannii TaxID=470 RepID=UPI0006173144|nr:hypothetical protein [Acinetobacter baumannii]HCV3101334.1 hypothetical protein [Acinetobacter baumannii]HCV3123893.1 hypothetical protein [Acinetobacter baumannii]HCV3147421.1 hypothetical protein [Acinetobacter baumannii]HCV3168228.1 hypothetical protein [Acinetobacter baumannii]HCV3289886.1 hypothetical protein [Acinetobacter baumannii]